MKDTKKMLILFLTPAVFMFLVIFLYPIIRTIFMSFFSVEGIADPISKWSFVGFENYHHLTQVPLFKDAMINLFKIWLYGGMIVMSLALLYAVILSSDIRGKKVFRAIMYLPNIVSAVALATMWMQGVFSSRFGILKTFFEKIGWESMAKFGWLSGSHTFMSLLIAYCFGMVGYHMLIFLSGIERISPEYFEAATIDGANKVEQFKNITFPLLKGVLKTNLIMWSISSLGFFVWSQLFSPMGMERSTVTPMVYMYTQTFGTATANTIERYSGLGAAIGVLLCICTVVLFWVINKGIKEEDVEF